MKPQVARQDLLKVTEGAIWSTTQSSLTNEEEDAIVTLVVVVIGIIAAVIFLFSMGLFIDCRTQKTESLNKMHKRKSRLKMPVIGRANRQAPQDDATCFATDMCPNGSSQVPGGQLDAIV
ncbi:hypothetical protein TKK_0016773 [Trichogramma kaykai]|uniref:Uncharacterized protein n=1 Tax=Trichogramma kaykai TaxID=54128 RepID=A0ABD2W3X5_9HYME